MSGRKIRGLSENDNQHYIGVAIDIKTKKAGITPAFLLASVSVVFNER